MIRSYSAKLRWLIVISSTLFVIMILLLPGDRSESLVLSLPIFLEDFFSLSFGRWGLFEAMVHVIIFFTLTFQWYWLLVMYYNGEKSLKYAVLISVVLGIGTELGQYLVNRGSLLFDLLANILGTVLIAHIIKRRMALQKTN